MRLRTTLSLALLLPLAACNRGGDGADETPEPTAPAEPVDPREAGFFEPLPDPPEVNPAVLALGDRLYHDTALSGDGTVSCASCHDIANGGDDGLATSEGINGQLGPINAPTVLNAGLHMAQFWDGRAADLKEQAAGPVTNPLEMGAEWDEVLGRLGDDPTYVEQFAAAGYDGITQDSVTDAIAQFESTLLTPSRFDAWLEGDETALNEQELAGLHDFMAAGCTSCHNGPALGGNSYQRMGVVANYFERRGGELTDADMGRFNVTGEESDRHMFKVPSLRNLTLTGPYFHDGSHDDLRAAVVTMNEVQLGRDITDEQVDNIVAFLGSLTGDIPEVTGPIPLQVPNDDDNGSPDGETPEDGSPLADEGDQQGTK